MNAFRTTLLLGLGVVIGLLLANLVVTPVATAGTASDGSKGLVAVTGKSLKGDVDVLWVVDAERKHLACYQYGQRGVEFLGARKIWYDLQLITYKDYSPPEVTIAELRKAWDKAKIEQPKDVVPPDITQTAKPDPSED